jgi:ectoine hydroxylase-related dioxygenase (phytanoyl-CoA dioxygenase family)
LPIHWDVDPRGGRHLYQAILHLTDSPVERGAFRCVPALWHDHEGWFERHLGADLGDVELEGNEVVAVPCHAGDLLIFDSRMAHGNGTNTDNAPRITQAVTMQLTTS